MNRISSRQTFYFKRVFPVLWFGFLIVFVAVSLAADRTAEPGHLLPFIVAPVGWTSFVNPPRVVLTLRRPGRFGKEIAFSPKRSGFWGSNTSVSALIERIDAARRG